MSNVRSILVVDDDPELANALSEQLALHDEFSTKTVDTAGKAIAAVKDERIDLALMDVGLPDM
ncbi:response regulator, partial [Nostoc sp. NIES-2111]